MPEPRKTVAVDLDGVLADFSRGFVDVHTIGDPIPGAVEFTRRLSQFADVLIWTTRCNPEIGRGMGTSLLRNSVRDWLDLHGFAYADIWTGPVKPIASAFIDDRAVECRPQDGIDDLHYHDAVEYVKRLCKDTPPGCSMSHTTPVLDAAGFRSIADAEEAAGSIAAGTRNTTKGGTPEVCRGLDREDGPLETAKVADGTPPDSIAPAPGQLGLGAGNSPEAPDGSPDDSIAALADRVCELLDAATRDGSLMYADRLPSQLSEALDEWRDAQ